MASFRKRDRFELEVITSSQNLCRSIGCPCLRHSHTYFISTSITLGILRSEQLHSVQWLVYVADKMEEPRKRDGLSLSIFLVLHNTLIFRHRG